MNTSEWWRGGVIYQIYPRSYQDSMGDGQGDLQGITQRLPYIAELGVDAIWISPFFKSPMKDFGYDVSDYRDIDPSFGSLADFDNLIARAHELGLKVMVDLVLSHSSDQHAWFKESRQNSANSKADWYVWADPKPDGTPPNNWLSIFGGPAWTWEPKREQYYLHNFLNSQPDLNFHNPEVQDAMLGIAKFWLDRDVDGFRLDTINFYFHDKRLRDNPPLPIDERNNSIAPSVNPYNHQNHLYDKNQPENLAFLKRLRSLMDEYEARTALGEVGDAQRGPELVAEYTSGGDKVHMCYAFDFLSPELLSPEKTVRVVSDFAKNAPDGWPCWAFSNHDVMRQATRLATQDTEAEKRLHAALLLSLPGTACIYQGEELGLPEADVPYEKLQDPYGITFWPEFKGRDGCRTPMVWTSEPGAGFSTADQTWLPIDDAHLPLSVAAQESANDSLLHFYRDFIKFRRAHAPMKDGAVRDMQYGEATLSFTRHSGDDAIFCAFNLSNEKAKITLPENAIALCECPYEITSELSPFSAVFARVEGAA